MSLFAQDITRFDGNICQIGDNDSGRFIKIQPDFIPDTLEENHLSQSNLINNIQAFFKTSKKCLNSDWIYRNTNQTPPERVNESVNLINNIVNFKEELPHDLYNYLQRVIEKSDIAPFTSAYSSQEYEFKLSGNTKLDTFLDTPKLSSTHSIVTGKVAALEEVENAKVCAGLILLKNPV